jgi:DNA-binding NtrC family response regulator
MGSHKGRARSASLVLDRFVRCSGSAALDLSTGRTAWVRKRRDISSECRLDWSERCLALLRGGHSETGRLLDFGVNDSGTAVEVFDLPGRPTSWTGRLAAALPERRIRRVGVREARAAPCRNLGRASSCREVVDLSPLPEIGAVLEALETGATCGPRVLFFGGAPGTGVRTAWLQLAREARLRGYVPISGGCFANPSPVWATLVGPRLRRLLRGRHLVIFHDARQSTGGASLDERQRILAGLLPTLAETGRPHLLIVARGSPRSPGVWIGRPERTRSRLPVAAESSTPYDVVAPRPSGEATCPAGVQEALAQARTGLRLVSSGRHAPGDRLVRRAIGALERRQHSAHAGSALMQLGLATLRRGRTAEALTLFGRARRAFERAGRPTGTVAAMIGTGLAYTDADQLPLSESTLRAALAAAEAFEDAGLTIRARLALGRCLLWRGELAGARIEVERAREERSGWDAPFATSADSTAAIGGVADASASTSPSRSAGSRLADIAEPSIEVGTDVAASALACRIALASGAIDLAASAARRALLAAEKNGRPVETWTSERAMAEVQASMGDAVALREHVVRAGRAARAAHLPLLQFRLRMTLVEGLHRAGREAEARRLATRLQRVSQGPLPPLVRRRLRMCRERCEMLASAQPEGTADTEGSWSGVRAFDQRAGHSARGSDPALDIVPEIIEFFRMCQEAESPRQLLDRACTRLQERLDSVSVVLVGRTATGTMTLVSIGRPLGASDIAERAMALGTTIGPLTSPAGHEAAAAIQYGGEVAAALAARWAVDRRPEAARSAAVLTAAASALAVAVRTVIDQAVAESVEPGQHPSGLLGVSRSMVDLRQLLARAAAAPFPVLIQGESGTGKELAARAIHEASPRRTRRFCAINCAALGEDLLEAELFGHARGAFTGAVAERPGLFEAADGGTLFLDEVGELSPRAQAKLLRATQEGEVRRLGENASRSVDVRLVAATNRALGDEVRDGRFRRDLLYRLDVISIRVPPLRQRPEDIPVLAARFWEEARARVGSRAVMTPAVIAALCRYNWPGNARELQNVMAAIAVGAPCRGLIGIDALPDLLRMPSGVAASAAGSLDQARRQFEEGFVRAALARAGGRRSRAAADLGLTRQGLSKLLVRLGIDAHA